MKTKGLEVGETGYLLVGFRRADGTFTPNLCIVPDAFWARLKRHIVSAGRVEEYKRDEAKVRESVSGHDVETVMFKTWVTKLGIDLPASHYPGEPLWPWSRGWTEEHVDAYLAAPSAKREAA
jgi:hypothetical protein